MTNDDNLDNTQPLDPQTEALRSMIRSLLEEQLRPVKEQLSRMEEEAKARYVDLRARLARMQESLDVLNEKFDAQAEEVKFLRKSVRRMEDKVDPLPA
jgi:predicted nuclease with TOPRIM domain